MKLERHGIHKKCNGVKQRLVTIPDFKCIKCLGLARHIDDRPVDHVFFRNQKLDVVESFVYLEDGISSSGSCEVWNIAGVRSTGESFVSSFPY